MLHRKFVVPVTFAAALTGGGLAGAVLGVPAVSSAQESDDGTTTTVDDGMTTTPETESDDSTEDGTENRADRNCPEKEDTSGTDDTAG